MPGTKEGGAKGAATNIARHGKDFYRRIGHKGGTTPKRTPSGFAAMPFEKVSAAGKKGGSISRRKTNV